MTFIEVTVPPPSAPAISWETAGGSKKPPRTNGSVLAFKFDYRSFPTRSGITKKLKIRHRIRISSCPAISAKFPSAQAESIRQRNTQNHNTSTA